MIAQLLSILSALIWLVAGAPETAPLTTPKPTFSIYEVTSPVPLQVVTGEVDIIGSVNLPGLFSYYVEVYRAVEGVEDWFPATLPYLQPVFDDRIGTFNTSYLPDGSYRMRLVVIASDDSRSTLPFGPVFVYNSQKVVPTPTPERRAVVTVNVDAPTPGQVVSGSVDFVGTVDARDLQIFFIEFTSADDDWDEWLPATLPKRESVQTGVLGTWNTTFRVDGDYHLRLNVLAGAEPRQHIPIGVVKVRNAA